MPNYYVIGGQYHGAVQALPDGVEHFQLPVKEPLKLEPIKVGDTPKKIMQLEQYIVRHTEVQGTKGRVLALSTLSDDEVVSGVICMFNKHRPPYEHWLNFNKRKLLVEHAASCTFATFEDWAEQKYRHTY